MVLSLHFTVNLDASEHTMITNELSSYHGFHIGQDLRDDERVVERVFLSLLQRACDVVAAVRVDARHRDVETSNVGGEFYFDLVRVLVSHKISVELEVVSLVDHTCVARAA